MYDVYVCLCMCVCVCTYVRVVLNHYSHLIYTVQQSSFYGLAGMLSKRHVQAIMVGESECMSSLSVWEYFHVCIASKHFSLVLFVFINHFSSLCTKDSLCTGCNREQLFMYSH